MASRRFTHSTDISTHHKLWETGQKQAEQAIRRYHYLCAAIQQAYDITTGTILTRVNEELVPRRFMTFSKYTAYSLPTVVVRPLQDRRPDGSLYPEDVEDYLKRYGKDWRCREGGILYCIEDGSELQKGEWWNLILNYHSPAGTTGHEVWDRLFLDLKENGYVKELIPCMFFAQKSGCLDPQCPFLHDEELCREDRRAVLRERRKDLDKPSLRELHMRKDSKLQAYHTIHPPSSWNSLDQLVVETIEAEPDQVAKICWNVRCLKVQYKEPYESKSEVMIKFRCKRCKTAWYCSAKCQKTDWVLHKQDPCLPLDDMLENDKFWNQFGSRIAGPESGWQTPE
ncbi:hypothetical protein BV25DRAFT_1832020 [Artomyces pyxidatus]|uniref:Uncharacterized protein n=1 Tax=Artomyces pyxidatus TaxID=48021 RepID=A0ACB8SKJ0_9AGAM|nr:hypothetical protein BV25DRAFT_1832020 [Artomyces pyxidatus]